MKKIITVLLTMAVLMCGCGEGEKQEVSQETNQEETEKELVSDELDSIEGFENAGLDYEKFNSPASENGLDGTLIYIDGKVLNQTKISDSEDPILSIVIEQEDGNRWSVSIASDSEIEEIQGKNVRAFGMYMGFSDVVNLPAIYVGTEDEEIMEKTRIDLEENEEYVTVWKFSDCIQGKMEEEGTETNKENTNVLFQKEYEVDGEKVNISMNGNEENIEINVFGNAKDEEKASIMLACYKKILGEISIDGYSITIKTGEASVIYNEKGEENKIMGTNKDGSIAFSAPEWIVTEFTMTEEEMNSFTDEIINTMEDFGESAEMNN